MGTPAGSVLRGSTCIEESNAFCLDEAKFTEAFPTRNNAARGAITGVILGAGLWGVILVLFGVIRF